MRKYSLTRPIPPFPNLIYPILSYPILSYPILSYPILSYPILSYSISPTTTASLNVNTYRKTEAAVVLI